MNPTVLAALRSRAGQIHGRWEMLLDLETSRTPAANAGALAFWIPRAMEHVFQALETAESGLPGITMLPQYGCACGRNPYLAFYRAGEKAFVEAVVDAVYECRVDGRREAAIIAIRCAIASMALRDVEGYCSVCIRRDRCLDRRDREASYLAGVN